MFSHFLLTKVADDCLAAGFLPREALNNSGLMRLSRKTGRFKATASNQLYIQRVPKI